MKQESLSDIEYGCRKKKTKREEFLELMDEIIPWDEWVGIIRPYYPAGKRGRPPIEIESMLQMYLLQYWFNLSDEGVEDAICDLFTVAQGLMGIAWISLPPMVYYKHRKRAGGAGVEFRPFVVLAATGEELPVQIVPAQDDD